VIDPAKTVSDQVQEIEKLVSDVSKKLDQIGYALQMLHNRLKEQEHLGKGTGG
jgi:hypothetical protein